MSSYYIYYKVPGDVAAKLKPAVEDLQRSLEGKTGVIGRLLCRKDKPDTWMEIYEDVPDPAGFEAALGSELQRVRFAELLGSESARRTEVFQPLP
jgi:hypothetical protein